jgi:hypothetical protein
MRGYEEQWAARHRIRLGLWRIEHGRMITHDLLPCAGEVTEMRMVETADQVQCIVDQHSTVTAVVVSLEL